MKTEIGKIVVVLQKRYRVRVRRERPFEVLVHGILSARTKDETTFPAQERLLKVADRPEKILKLQTQQIEKLIYPVGFYKTKARHLKEMSRFLLERFGGKVPSDRRQLMEIPGVGPKVAGIVQVWGFGIASVPVDTHVNLVSQRLGFVPKGNRPEKTQEVLERIVPERFKIVFNQLFVMFGKDICRPARPHCFRCPVYSYCRFEGKSYYRKHIPSNWVKSTGSGGTTDK